MKHVFFLIACLASLVLAEDELKVYGIITYLAQDNSYLHLGDMTVMLTESEIEGVLTVGALVKVEGFWQGQGFYAEEVEVEHPQTDVVVYQGRVDDGLLLGIDMSGLGEGTWLEVIAERHGEDLTILLVKPLTAQHYGLQGLVESLTKDGFVAAGVKVVSSQKVSLGQQVHVVGTWNGMTLTETTVAAD